MSTTKTPTPGRRRPAARVIALLTVAFGAAVVVATGVGAIAPAVALGGRLTETRTVDADGVTAVDLDIEATSFSVRYGDVDEATLDLRDAIGGSWTFEREGATLAVRAPRPFFLGWFRGGNGTVTLTLPDSLEDGAVDLGLAIGAGDAKVDGAFGDVDIDMGAGTVSATGQARSLLVDVGAGRADLDLDGVTTADLSVSAGEMDALLGGEAPEDVTATVSAGSLDLTLPEGAYAVTSDVSAGDFDNGLRTDPSSANRVSVDVSAGRARLVSE